MVKPGVARSETSRLDSREPERHLTRSAKRQSLLGLGRPVNVLLSANSVRFIEAL